MLFSITLLRMSNLNALRAHLPTLGRVILGYSGGVDSGLLAVTGAQTLGPGRFLAVMGRSASYPAVQADAALALARSFDIPLFEVETHELEDPRYLRNSTERCYFCKSELWNRLETIKREQGFDTIIDGTNADDVGEHRPGMRAAAEQGIRSPLVELGWTKQDVRAAALELGLPIWDAPAAPCLSSRVLYGLEITPERLHQVEQGEAYLRSLGVRGDLRVRHHGGKARLEVATDQMNLLRNQWEAIEAVFAELGFTTVELDSRGYRRGGLLNLAPRASH
ncbi:MAG TPA: ATP-dependent sacrificial sulfur transferase LarE [Gemmatimonadales bacterium]|nr:ATP-dependent sacrificial sulfur transferase LarE [Gemmatimonadales bacterium]